MNGRTPRYPLHTYCTKVHGQDAPFQLIKLNKSNQLNGEKR
jgi:hypothetical protein